MNGRFVLFSGSASLSCPTERLVQAIRFLDGFVIQVLQAGGGFVVLLGNEDRTKGDDGEPRIFDWTILRKIQHYAESTTDVPRVYLGFAHFKPRRRVNLQVGGTGQPGLSIYPVLRRIVKNPPTPATGGGAPGRWHLRRSATA